MGDAFHDARVTDAVHGTFGISQLEADIISTPVFQRLHNVRQLGLAHLVYPGADYSRFAHSLGACHIAGKMLRAIDQNCKRHTWSERDIQLYRLAGLLHDIGHYPFSHATEHEVLNHYKAKAYLTEEAQPASSVTSDIEGGGSSEPTTSQPQLSSNSPPPAYHHEPLGRAILSQDRSLTRVLEKHGFSGSEIKSVLLGEIPGGLTTLVSSDLDCDRLDYLMRTAHCAGLPYGKVDIEYIVSQTCLDSEGRLCITKKALRAADHLLISRYYDYTQVVFHKTVVGLELVLRDAIKRLLNQGLLDFSGAAIANMIEDGSFANLDDQFLIGRMRSALGQIAEGDPLRVKIPAILNRHPPKLVASSEAVGEATKNRLALHLTLKQQLEDKMQAATNKFELDPALWYLWDRYLGLSKIGSKVPLSDVSNGSFEEESAQAVRVLTSNPNADPSSSKPLIEHEFALMNQLSQSNLYVIRLYLHLPPEREQLRSQIMKYFRDELPHFPFSP